MARIETNKAPKKILVDGDGARNSIIVTDQTDSGTRLATLTVLDKNTLPEFLDNVLTVGDPRFEIRDGGLYLKPGEQLPVGRFELLLTATDAQDPLLFKTQMIKFDVSHVEPAAGLSGDTLALNHDGAAAITLNEDGGWHVVVGTYGMDLTVDQVAAIANVQLHGNNALDLAGDAMDGKPLAILGGGGDSLDITGVELTESTGGSSVGSDIDISHLSTELDFLVNGSQADAFIATWNYLDDAYAWLASHGGNLWGDYGNALALPDGVVFLGHATYGAAALAVNMAVAQLDIDYANYLYHGGSAEELTGFIAKTNGGGTREQTIHDNLLGAVSEFGITDRNFPDDVEADFLAQIPGDFASRPYASGELGAYSRPSAGTIAAKAWDFARDIDRVDYESHFIGPVDVSGTKGDGTMLFGNGNPATGYTIAIHDGSGVEFGFNVHYRTGDQIAGHVGGDGLVHFEAPSGHQVDGVHNMSGNRLDRSATSVDYALITGLNGTHGEVTDYVVKLSIDLDATAAVNYKTFTMVADGAGVNYFVADNGVGLFGDTNAMTLTVAEDSINFGYSFLADPLNTNAGDLAPGTYDMLAQVWDASGTVQLVGNHIVLDVV
jgi:hypothetical protein